MTLVVPIEQHLHEGSVRLDPVKIRMAEVSVGDAEDEFLCQARISVESVLGEWVSGRLGGV